MTRNRLRAQVIGNFRIRKRSLIIPQTREDLKTRYPNETFYDREIQTELFELENFRMIESRNPWLLQKPGEGSLYFIPTR